MQNLIRPHTHWLLIAMCLWSPLCLHAQLQPFKATYKATNHGIPVGTVIKRLQQVSPTHYAYTVDPIFSGFMKWVVNAEVHMRANFKVQNNHVLPMRYQYQVIDQKGRPEKNKNIQLRFEGAKACDALTRQCVTSKEHDRLYDPLSLDVAYALALQSDPNPSPKPCYPVVGNSQHVRCKTITIVGDENIRVPAGRFNTLKVTITSQNKPPATLWLAKSLHYLPVKIIQHQKKYLITFKMTAYEPI